MTTVITSFLFLLYIRYIKRSRTIIVDITAFISTVVKFHKLNCENGDCEVGSQTFIYNIFVIILIKKARLSFPKFIILISL